MLFTREPRATFKDNKLFWLCTYTSVGKTSKGDNYFADELRIYFHTNPNAFMINSGRVGTHYKSETNKY